MWKKTLAWCAIILVVCIVGCVAGCATLPEVAPPCAESRGHLVLSELMVRPAEGEAAWVEVQNRGLEPLNLDGMVLRALKRTADGELRDARHVLFGAGDIGAGDVVMLWGEPGEGYSYNHDGLDRLGRLEDEGLGGIALECEGEVLDELWWNWEPRTLQIREGVSVARGVWDDWCFGKETGGSPGEPNPPCGACEEGDGLRVRQAPEPGDLSVTEVLLNPLGLDKSGVAGTNRFWVELTAHRSVDLEDVLLVTVADGVEGVYPLTPSGCGRVEAGEPVVVGGTLDVEASGGAPVQVVADGLDLGALRRTSWDGRVEIWAHGVLIVSQSLPPAQPEAGRTLSLDGLAPSAGPPHWMCPHPEAEAAVGASAEGFLVGHASPGRPNPPCGNALCWDGAETRPARWPTAGTLQVSEVLADPSGSDTDMEWLEVQVRGTEPVDLNGLLLWVNGLDSDGKPSVSALSDAECVTVQPGEWVKLSIARGGEWPEFFAKSALPNSNPFRLDLTTWVGDLVATAVVPVARSKGAWALRGAFDGARPQREDFCPSAPRDGQEGSPGCPNACDGDTLPSCP